MLLSAVSVLVVAQSCSEVPEGLMNNPVCNTLLPTVSFYKTIRDLHICRPCVSRFYSHPVGEAKYVEFMSMSEDKKQTDA